MIHSNSIVDLLEYVDILRLNATCRLDEHKKAELSQFFTPAPIARLMASMLESTSAQTKDIHILDAGAGVGILFTAAIAESLHREVRPEHIRVTACEIDGTLIEYTHEALRLCQQQCEGMDVRFSYEVVQDDFIEYGVSLLEETLFSTRHKPVFTHAILNPPYHKIASGSQTRRLLHSVDIEATNLYTGFLEIVTELLAPSGELVAITPRSFCNGPYFKRFRQTFLNDMILRRLHVFESRQKTFDDDVLQESIILHAIKGRCTNGNVTISSSKTHDEDLILSHDVAYDQVVHPHDVQAFIHIVSDDMGYQVVKRMARFHSSLEDLGLNISTGRVVDFRSEEFLRQYPDEGTVPLIYPTHFHNAHVVWPKKNSRKPNAILDT